MVQQHCQDLNLPQSYRLSHMLPTGPPAGLKGVPGLGVAPGVQDGHGGGGSDPGADRDLPCGHRQA